jgi:hypothetical protein
MAINPDLLKSCIEAGERAMQTTFVLVEIDTYVAHPNLDHYQWEQDEAASNMKAPASQELQRYLDHKQIPYDMMSHSRPTEIRDIRKRAQFAAVKRWFDNDWKGNRGAVPLAVCTNRESATPPCVCRSTSASITAAAFPAS